MNTKNTRIKFLSCGAGVVCALALTAGPMAANSVVSALASGAPVQPAAPVAVTSDRVERPITADDKPRVLNRAHAARAALEMPDGAQSKATHVKDLARTVEYDEVVEEDAAGQAVALTQVDGAGQLLAAVRLDRPGKVKAPLGRGDALKKAAAGASAAGVVVPDQGEAVENPGVGGWDVTWRRTRDGVPVRGDEVRVHLREDGVIGSVGQVNHQLAAAPGSKLSRAQAKAMAGERTKQWSSRAIVNADFTVGDADLAWVGPNAAFDASKIGATEQPYRLSWVVTVTPTGEAAAYVRQVMLFLDAGDGSLIGGDVVE